MAARTQPIAIVTGANTGIGYETALELVKRHYIVVLACRNETKGSEAATLINKAGAGVAAEGHAVCMPMDLANLSTVTSFAAAFRSRFDRLHCLVLNAGMNLSAEHTPENRKTVDGFDICMQTNYLGHFLLCSLLSPLIVQTSLLLGVKGGTTPCRIVTLSSVAHRLVKSKQQCIWPSAFVTFNKPTYDVSKIACTMMVFELQRRFSAAGIDTVQVIAANPGAVNSDIWRHLPDFLLACLRPAMSAFFLTNQQGAATSIAAATQLEIDGKRVKGGEYLVPYHVSSFGMFVLVTEALGPFAGAKLAEAQPIARDQELWGSLWTASEAAVQSFLDVHKSSKQ